jgi:SAM-dependent methyltransferase
VVPVGDESFGAYYYANCCGRPYERNDQWLARFRILADRIVQDIAPARVLDAGCALGLLVEVLRERGVDAWGIDLSSYAIDHVHEKVRPYCTRGSIAVEFDSHYDLILCIEVAEHMAPAEAEAAVANICRHTDDVLFSSSPVDQREPTHVNVRPPEHWAEIFARHDFFRDTDFDASFVTPWAARYRRRSDPIHRVIRGYERRYWHLLSAATDARAYSMEQQNRIEALEAHVTRAEAETAAAHRAHEATSATLLDTQDALAQARDRIVHMERSRFWQAREAWHRMKAHLSGRS